MGPLCEFCGEIRSTVYCRADAARLCLSCDRHVHAANALSERHPRTLLCDGCNVQPAAIRCINDKLSLCQKCDRNNHSSSAQHERRSINCYTGCPSAAELAELWGCDLDGLSDDFSRDGKEGSNVSGLPAMVEMNKGWGNSGADGSLDSVVAGRVNTGLPQNFGSWMEASPSTVASSEPNVNTMLFTPERSVGSMVPNKVAFANWL